MRSKTSFLEDDKIQTEIYPIRIYEVDPSLKLTIRSICNFIQDAPAEQVFSWGLAVPQLLERNLTWMLSRLLIRMESYPSRKQGFVVQTWPSGRQPEDARCGRAAPADLCMGAQKTVIQKVRSRKRG